MHPAMLVMGESSHDVSTCPQASAARRDRPGAHPQLLHHRPHRPRQVDAGRPHAADHRRGRATATCGRSTSTAWTSSASAASPSRARPCACRGRSNGSTYALNMIDTPGTSTSPTRCRGRSPPARARSCSSTPPRASRPRLSRTSTWRSRTTSRSSRCSTRSTCPRPTPTSTPASSPASSAATPADVLRVSGKTGVGVEELLDRVIELIPAPQGDPDAPARAMIFDSVYDSYRGVVTYVRMIDGQLNAARAHPDDVDPRHPRDPRDRRQLARADPQQGSRRRRGRLPDHRREGRAPVEGRRHRHDRGEARDPGAARLHRAAADGLLGPVPDRRQRLPRPARGARQAEAVGCRARLRARDLRRARLRLPLRLPRPAAPRDRHRAPRARVRPRPHHHGAVA